MAFLAVATFQTNAKAMRVLIDFGVDTLTTAVDANGQNWNNVSEVRLVADGAPSELVSLDVAGNLIDSAGNDSGFTFSAAITDDTVVKIGGDRVDFTNDGAPPLEPNPTGTVYPATAYGDSLFINDDTNAADTSDQIYTITVGGLDDATLYDFTFLSAFTGGGANGDVFVRLLTGTTTSDTMANAGFEDNAMNVQAWLQLSEVNPAGGLVEIEIYGVLNNNGRINTMEFAPSGESGIRITDITYDEANSMISLTWVSDPATSISYTVRANPNLDTPVRTWGDLDDGVTTQGTSTTFEFSADVSADTRMFFVVEENPPLP